MALPCARCNAPLPAWELASGDTAACTSCGSSNQVRVFPAAVRSSVPVPSETALDGEAACFDHPAKRAVAACRHCGRFVCALCSIQFGDEVWCPACVVGRAGAAHRANPDTSCALYDSIAVLIPWFSLIFWPITIITGPGAVVFSILKWRQPISLVRRNRWRFVVAILTGLGAATGWVLLIGFMFASARRGAR